MSARRPVAAIVAVVCALLLAPTAANARRSPSPLIDRINKVRKAHGLHPVRYSSSLSWSSSRFAHHLASTGRLEHSPRILASSRFSKLGEVLARSRGWKVRRGQTLAAWLASPSHRAVLLNPSYRYVGAARARGGSRGNRAVFWTVQLGRP